MAALAPILELNATIIKVIHAIKAREIPSKLDLLGRSELGEHVLTFDSDLLRTPGLNLEELALAARPGEPFRVFGHRPAVRVQKGMEYEALIALARADGAFADILVALSPSGPRSRLSPLAV
jgi:hypothetical protein